MKRLSSLVALVAPLAACTLINPGPDGIGLTDANLPNGITLLQADENECDGTVIAAGDETLISSRPGETRAFKIERQRVVWTCVDGNATSSEDSLECPLRTSHVRITRPADGETFLVECFG